MTTLPDDHTDWSAVGAYQDQFTGILCKSGAGARFKRARRAGVIYARPARKGALYRGSGGGLLLCEEVGDEVFDLASKVSSIFGLRLRHLSHRRSCASTCSLNGYIVSAFRVVSTKANQANRHLDLARLSVCRQVLVAPCSEHFPPAMQRRDNAAHSPRQLA